MCTIIFLHPGKRGVAVERATLKEIKMSQKKEEQPK